MVRTKRAYRWVVVGAAVVFTAASVRAASPDSWFDFFTPAKDRAPTLSAAAEKSVPPKATKDKAAKDKAAPDLGTSAPGDRAAAATKPADGSTSATVIERRLEPGQPDAPPAAGVAPIAYRYPIEPPLGFTGRTSILPQEFQGDSDFVPMPDRWRSPFPSWDRYGNGNPPLLDIPYELGNICDPYNQNVLKGDYPIIGQHTFFNLTATSFQLMDTRQTPIGTTPRESTARPFEIEFFGSPNQLVYSHFLSVTFDLNHGDAAFKPTDWRILVTPIFNANTLNVDELAVVNPNVLKGTQRDRTFMSLQEYFIETKISDLSVYYDFVSARIGSQFFSSDFRGFLFSDTNRAIRIFGTRFSDRDQFNLAYFRQAEKDTNSTLNTMDDRGQNVLIANYYRQDFIFPGYTIEGSVHYNHDPRSFRLDTNGFLVRPDPVGTFQPHTLDVVYLGFGGDGHIDRFNITNQFYYALGHDTFNPLANQSQSIRAWMAAIELSYDRDWARFRTSFFYSSGDHNVNNSHATGFDTIFDDPNFAGGQFSFWQRQAIALFGTNLKNRGSLIPDLRARSIQGQSEFVNPGLLLLNVGFDADLTPKIKWINNVNFLWFETTKPLETFLFATGLDTRIGTDISTGLEYRPLLSNNIIITGGVSTLVPGSGFKAIYDQFNSSVSPLVAAFLNLTLTY